MLLVMQMQGADFDFTNTDSYGHGPPPATPASGYTALNTTGRYEYVMATSGVTAGSVNISGLGTGAGLVYSYTTGGRHRHRWSAPLPGDPRSAVHDGHHEQQP